MRTVDFKKGRKKYRKKFYLKSPQSVSDKTDNVFTMEDKLSTQNYKILIFDGHYITGYILFTYLNNFRPIRLENFAQYDLPRIFFSCCMLLYNSIKTKSTEHLAVLCLIKGVQRTKTFGKKPRQFSYFAKIFAIFFIFLRKWIEQKTFPR